MPVVDVGGSLQGKPNAVPYEDQAGMSEVQRKRLLMQQLLKESLSGGSGVVPDSGALKVPDYAGAIGKVLQAYIGTKGAEAGAREADALAQKAQDTHRQEMQKFNIEAFGGPFGGYKFGGQEMAGPPKGPSEYSGMSKGDMVEAIKNASLSKDPQTRTFGQDLQKKNIELDLAGQIRAKDKLQYGDRFLPESMGGDDVTQYQLKPQIHMAGGVAGQITPGKPGFAVPPVAPATYKLPEIDPTTGFPVQETVESGEVKSLPGPTQPVVSHLAAINTEQLKTGYAKAQVAVNVLKNVATIQDQLKNIDPSAMGPLTDVRSFFNRLLAQVGGEAIPEGTAVEKLNSMFGERLMDVVHAFAPVTKVDLNKGETIAGSTKNSVQAAMDLTDYMAELAQRSILNHNAFVEKLDNKKGYEGVADQWGVNFSVKGMPPTEAKPSQYESEVARMRGEAASESGSPQPPLPENATTQQKRDYYLEEVRRKRKAGQ